MDRVHRLGQSRPVTVTRLATASTVEVGILQLAQSKTELANALRGTGTTSSGGGDDGPGGPGGVGGPSFQSLLAQALQGP